MGCFRKPSEIKRGKVYHAGMSVWRTESWFRGVGMRLLGIMFVVVLTVSASGSATTLSDLDRAISSYLAEGKTDSASTLVDEAFALADAMHVIYRGHLSERMPPHDASTRVANLMAGVA